MLKAWLLGRLRKRVALPWLAPMVVGTGWQVQSSPPSLRVCAIDASHVLERIADADGRFAGQLAQPQHPWPAP